MKTNNNSRRGDIRGGAAAFIAKDLTAWLLLLPAVLCMYFFVLRPQLISVYWSFFNMNGYTVGDFVGLDNYVRIIKDPMFIKALKNTFVYVFWSLLLGYAFPIFTAVMMNEILRGRKTMRFLVYFPSAMPAVSVMMLWFLIYYPDASGLLNIILSWVGIEPQIWLQDSRHTIMYIIICMTWSGAGATAIYYFSALQEVSRELYEAAIVDGAGFWRRFRVVTFPHISGVALLFLVRQIVGVFSVMEQPLQMTDGGPDGASMTLGLLAYKYGFVSVRPQLSMAINVIMFLILIVFTGFYFYLNKKVEDSRG